MDYKVGQKILFLSKSKYSAQQVMAVITAVAPVSKHREKAQVVARVTESGEKVVFSPDMPIEYVKILPDDVETITDALMYLATQNMEM